jgi:hypothetical protein
MQITTIGLDLAKNVFQVHGIGATEIRRSEATPAQPGDGILQGAAAVPCRDGGLRHGLL